MEVDERLRWLEARISSSLRPRGEEMRSLFSDEENRAAFLAFCNHSESRRLFVHLEEEGEGTTMRVSARPPQRLSEKSITFLKCSHASKLTRESIGRDVVYSECSELPLEHLELVVREVYLPLMTHGDRQLDLLHRLLATTQVTQGLTMGKVLLPIPSISVLAEAASSADRRATVIHILESSVVAWMKQIKMALHFDPSSAILKSHGIYAGPLAEIEFWTSRLSRLEAVRSQLTSMVVLNVLHNLDQAHSTYAQAFQHVHHDIGRAIVDAELSLMYLSALRPWCLKLEEAYSPETITCLFPPLMMTLLLIWQHSGFYSVSSSLHRLLRLCSNKVTVKAKNIVGQDLLKAPEESLVNLKQALRVCAAFRGCYLDFWDKAEGIVKSQREALQHGDTQEQYGSSTTHTLPDPTSTWSLPSGPLLKRPKLAPWPPRNSPVFGPLNAIMERCYDLLELVQTVLDFRELEAAAYGVDGTTGSDPLLADDVNTFTSCVQTFKEDSKDLLNLEPESSFEEKFFLFRSTVRPLERRLAAALKHIFDHCPTLMAELRVLEMFQGVCRRETMKENLCGKFDGILLKIFEDVEVVREALTTALSLPPSHPHTPPVTSKLLWLHALRERVRGPMEKLREISPELLEGEPGWKLRQAYGSVNSSIESHIAEAEGSWSRSIPLGLAQRLKANVLTHTPSGLVEVNLDPTLCEVLHEASHLSRAPLRVSLPPAVRHVLRSVDTPELWERSNSLQAVVQMYHSVRDGLSDVDKLLFQHRLQLAENLLSVGLEQLDWTSASFPDFIAQSKTLFGDLQSAVTTVHYHTSAVWEIAESWSRVPGLDVFEEGEEGTLHALQERHSRLLESLHSILPTSAEKIKSHINLTLQCVDASPESPAWAAYLSSVDREVVRGLKTLVLTAVGSLTHRAQQYEQGVRIPSLVTVCLELQGTDIQFSPPLSPLSPLPTVPEVVHHWMEGYSNTASLVVRQLPGVEESCYSAISSDQDILTAIKKICAHLETSARQCQSLRKRFTIYSFLWEQDVQTTFQEFLRGQAVPHPRRFTRPETVRSRASARVHSGRPMSSSNSPSQAVLPTPEAPLLGVMGVSDWDFLCPPGMDPTDGETSPGKRPSLDDFDGEIAVFQGILDRLNNMEDVVDVGWLCVDQQPAKQVLTSLAAKWKYVYASYLEKQVVHVLESLEKFFQEVEPEVEGISGEERDMPTFMKLMSTFNRVNTQQVEMDTKFGAVHRAVLILDKFGHPLPSTTRDQFTSAPQRWSNLKKRVALSKQRIGPRIQSQEDLITKDLAHFADIFTSLRRRFEHSTCLDHRCPREDIWNLIGEFGRELEELQGRVRDLAELQELLETSVFNFSLLKEFEEELVALQETWKTAESVLLEHRRWCRQSWQQVDCGDLLAMVGMQREMVCSLPAVAQGWDVYHHTMEAIDTMQLTAPLVEGLRSSAMRPRHWKQVLRYTVADPSPLLGRGGTFNPSLLDQLTFGQLLSMKLHTHQAEVLAVVERADKDIAIESLLNTFEEVWLSRQLELKIHLRAGRHETISDLGIDSDHSTPKSRTPARVTSAIRRGVSHSVSVVSGGTPLGEGRQKGIPLLSNTAGIFETLDSHQTSLQSLAGTVAAVSFTDDLQKWHKQLQTIEAVLRVWLDVQQLWVQLEEVYSSVEVQQQLPSPSFTFSSVDREWRTLMFSTARNPAVMATCLKEGLLPSLEKLHSGLLQCRAALVRYVEGQRVRCPWFYLLPLEDILHFTCYGSNSDQLSSLISKLLPHAGALTFNHTLPRVDHTPSHTHFQGGGRRITGVVSRLGEIVELTQAVLCEGTVESVLTQLFTSLSSTLHNQLTTTLTKHLSTSSTPSHPHPALSNLPLIWSRPLATQITILITHITVEVSLEKAVLESSQANQQPLKELNNKLNSLIAIATKILKGKFPKSDSHQLDSTDLPDGEEDGSGSKEEGSGLPEEGVRERRGVMARYQLHKLQTILLVLSQYRQRVLSLTKHITDSSSTGGLGKSFLWQSMLHYHWLSQEQTCQLSILHVSLPYGYHFTGSASRVVLAPETEKVVVFLLRAVTQGSNTLLTGSQGSGKSAVVHELAVSSGHHLTFLQCSPELTHSILIDFIRGMAATGSWLFLRGLDWLPPAVLQTTCDLLMEVQRARETRATSLHWRGETIRVTHDNPSACFASVLVHPRQSFPRLPSSVSQAFKTCSVPRPDLRLVLEVLFLVHEFETAVHLAKQLNFLCDAFTELLGQNLAARAYHIETESAKSQEELVAVYCRSPVMDPPPRPPLGLQILRGVISLAQRHMQEFDALGLMETGGGEGGGLHALSTVYSEISESTRASLKFRSTLTQGSGDPTSSRHSLEEFSLVLAVKDSLLPSLPPSSPSHFTLTHLMADLFHTSCDVHGLLAHEEKVRGVLAERAREDKSAVESARESRAASVMMMMEEGRQMSEVGSTLEDHVVNCCHLLQLSPSAPFQLAVAQFISLVQLHPIIAISGPSCSGKTGCIQCGAEVMRGLCGVVSCVTLAIEAMREEQLMGYQLGRENLWREGLLPQLLARHSSPDVKPATQWIVLEGTPSPSQLDMLVSLLAPRSSLPLNNGGTITLDTSHRFILELPDLSCLTPSSAVKVPALCTSQTTLTWTDVVTRWLCSEEHVKHHAPILSPLFDQHLPKILTFLAPALLGGEVGEGGGGRGEEESVTSVEEECSLEVQQLQLSAVHVTMTTCNLLQSLLPTDVILSSVEVERCFMYAVVWACGGFLTSSNKPIFDNWLLSNCTHLPLPEGGSLREYYLDGDYSFTKLSKDVPLYAAPVDSSLAPFVHTTQSAAIKHLVNVLIDRGIPVLLSGAPGSGKTALLKQFLSRYCTPGVSDIKLLHILVNHFTTSEVVWNQVLECLEWRWGRRYTPRGCQKLVCFIDDLHNTKSPTMCELVRQHVACGGMFDPDSGKWHEVSNVCYLCTTTHTTPPHQLRPQFMKHFAVLHWDGYNSDELVHIFSTVLSSNFSRTNQSPVPVQTDQSEGGTDPSCLHRLAQTAVQVHEKVCSMFLPTPERLHYLFSLRHLAAVFRYLCVCGGSGASSRDLLLLWQCESWWVYAGGLGSEVDRERYWEAVSHALRKFFSQEEELSTLLSEDSVRLPLQTVRELQSQLLQEQAEHHPTLHINLRDSTVEEVWHMSHVISSPHDLGHMILLGHAYPDPLVHSAALHCGFTVVQPSQYFHPGLTEGGGHWGMSWRSYDVQELKRDLKAVYTSAGVKNEKLLLLLTNTELLHEEFLTCVYEFVKEGAISPLFSKEERSHIVNAIRSDLTRTGLEFSHETAWKFFIDRVSSNLRVVLSFPHLRDVIVSGSEGWRELVGSVRVCCHLPWDRRQLVDTALYHLTECQLLPPSQCESTAHLLASIHLQLSTTISSNNATYEYLVERFVHELQHIHSSTTNQCNQVTAALKRVRQAREKGEALERKVGKERVVLGEKSEACEQLLVQVGQDTAISQEHSKLAAKQRSRIAHLRRVIPDYEHACELAAQERDDTKQSLQQLVHDLDQMSLTELRALAHPSADVEALLGAIITIVKGPSADHSWTKGAKRFMANLDRFRELLFEFSTCEENSEMLVEALEPLLERPPSGQLKSEGGGVAVAQLHSWVQGVLRLHMTLQGKLRPLQAKVTSMKVSLSEYSEKLRHQEGKVKVLQERLRGLTAALESTSVEKTQQQELVNKMSKELQETQTFISALSGVDDQWREDAEQGGCALHQTLGALTLVVSMATYLSPLPPHTQMEIIVNQLVPLLEERGVDVHWKPSDPFVSVFCHSSSFSLGAKTPQEDRQGDVENSAIVHTSPAPEPFPSYPHLSASILPFLVEASLVDGWLAEGYELSRLLQLGLMESTWHRWPLMYDPEGYAASWIKQSRGEELVWVDATDRSSKFYLTVEQALLAGQPVLIVNTPTTHPDPTLQPLIELAHTWDVGTGSKVIKFCGRQLHVAPSFHLYLTTTDPPNTTSPSLSTTTTVINCASSLPLSQEMLLDTAFHVFHEQGWAELRKTVGGVAKCRSEVTKLERELFESVGREEEGGYWWSTEKIAKIMAAKKEVAVEMNSHMEKLRDLLALRSLLFPLAHHAALVHSLLRSLSYRLGRPYYHTSWESYLSVFASALKRYHTSAPELMTASGVGGRREAMITGVIQAVNKGILQDTIRFLDHQDWRLFAMCLVLLAHCSPHHDTELDQLLYLSQGSSYLEELDVSNQLPPNPACVSEELWRNLHKLPLDSEYFRQVVQSMHSTPNFWEQLQHARGESSNINALPWRKGGDDDNPITLNDLVLWSCIDQDAVVQTLQREASVLLQSTSAPTLTDILTRPVSGRRGEPVLFLSEEDSVVSETNFYNLEEELRSQLQGRSLRVLRLGAGLEAKASDLLAQPNSDSLLLVGVQYGSVAWVELLLWRVRRAINTGCLVMLTTSVAAAHHLPLDLLRACRVVLLSNVVFSPTHSLPRSIWTRKKPQFHNVLQFLLASIPDAIMSQCNTLQQEFRPVLFGLTLLHAAAAAGEDRQPVGRYLAPRFCFLLASIQYLLLEAKKSSGTDMTVCSLQAYVREVYSGCVARERLGQLINTCLNNPPGGTSITLSEGVQVTVPLSSVHPRQYAEHVKGSEDDSSGISTSSPPPDIVSSSVDHLLPVFATVPGTDHDFTLITPHPSTFSPSLVDVGRVREVLESCLEQLPSPLPLRGACGVGEVFDRVLPLCVQLPSAEQYRSYALYTAVCQFNSALSTIRHDVALLVRSAAVGFDSLPREMVAVLEAVWSGKMPVKWSQGVCSEALSLKDGMTALQKLSTLLRTNSDSCTPHK